MSRVKNLKMYGATANFRNDEILHIHYEAGHLSLEDAQTIINSIQNKSPWLVCPVYISADPFSEHDSNAQKFLSGEDVMKNCSAVAILATSLAQKTARNFFVKICKSSIPTVLFTSESEAIRWLREFESIEKK